MINILLWNGAYSDLLVANSQKSRTQKINLEQGSESNFYQKCYPVFQKIEMPLEGKKENQGDKIN